MRNEIDLVLIVEDDAGMRNSIERLLQAYGFATSAFESAEAFLQNAIVDNAIALVLDVHLGAMSGIELRRYLSAVKSTIPVVFISASDAEETRNQALAAGCVEFLLKPFESSRLLHALERGRTAPSGDGEQAG